MATINLGRLALVWKGTYSGATAYVPKDIVEYTTGGITSSYICTANSTGNVPTNTSYWSLMAKGQPQTFNDNVLRNDIATLAIRQATSENKGAYNTNSMYVDVFQDDTGISSHTNTKRSSNEYLVVTGASQGGIDDDTKFFVDGADSSAPFTDLINGAYTSLNDLTGTGGTPSRDAGVNKWGSYGTIALNEGTINYGALANVNWGNAWTIEFWARHYTSALNRDRYISIGNDGSDPEFTYGFDYATPGDVNFYNDGNNIDHNLVISYSAGDTNWHHHVIQKHTDGSDGAYSFYFDGNRIVDSTHATFGNIGNEKFRINGRPSGAGNSGGEYTPMHITDVLIHQRRKYTGASYTVPTVKALLGQEGDNATGTVESNAITAPSSVSEMGAIISYQDFSGTNALNTDIVLQLSADNGSNYATATLEALPNYSSTIKMAKVNDLAVTAGTQLKYKINFANQALGSKVGRILGVSLMY